MTNNRKLFRCSRSSRSWPGRQRKLLPQKSYKIQSFSSITATHSRSIIFLTSCLSLNLLSNINAFAFSTQSTLSIPYNKNLKRPPRPLSAAAAWPFTPDRTGAILADTMSDAAIKTTSAAMEVALDAATVAAAVTTDSVVQTIYKAPFLSLAISFLLGGLFFSTVAAGVAAVYAFGRENTRRLKDVASILWRRNWNVVMMSLTITLDVLLGKEKISGFRNRFAAALQTLKDGFIEVRRVFTESVDAIKKETQMYSAAVGLPGLIPIQYIFDRIFPLTLTAPFESAIEDALAQTARDNTQIKKLVLKKFSMGDTAPRVLEARLFDLGNEDMAFDLEMIWKSNASANLKMKVAGWATEIPISIQNLRFEGPVRLIVVGLTPSEPGWQALLISLPRPPKIGFDLKVAGGLITQIPWLRNELAKMLDDIVAKEVLWPRRAVVSAPSPSKSKPLLNPIQMLTLMRDDPLLRRERELMASIPDDFQSNYKGSSQKDIPNFDIRTIGNSGSEQHDDVRDHSNQRNVPIYQQLKFWQSPSRSTEVEGVAVDTLHQLALSLHEENLALSKPVVVLEVSQEKKGVFQQILDNILIPRSLISYANRESF